MDTIRTLSDDEMKSPEFQHLLWLSTELDAASLRRIREQDLHLMTVLGSIEGTDLLGFVAFHATPQSLTIEYIATSTSARGTGLGRRILRAAQRTHPGIPMNAETDDDAIGFYRALGFAVKAGKVDDRWPDRSRYLCTLRTPL